MRLGLALLGLAYVFSQFFRAFLAVLAEPLARDLGATPDDLARASGLWFLAFAAMQVPVGWALDRIGPRRTSSVLFLIGGAGGAALFALAQSPAHVSAAMALIGVGCAPVLMGSYYIFARSFPASAFATLGAVMIGVGSIGNLAGTVPLELLVEAVGWRATLAGLAGITGALALTMFVFVQDPPRLDSGETGGLLDVLRIPALWLIIPLMLVNYAPAAGLRGLWIGPYMAEVQNVTAGVPTLIMGLAMIAGTFAYGPLDRWLGTRKWVVVGGTLMGAAACLALWAAPRADYVTALALFSAVGFFGMAYPLMMAHARAFVPMHLAGRGVTLMNLFSIGGVGLFQMVTGRLHAGVAAGAESAVAPYTAVFLLFAALLLGGLLPYLFIRDRVD
ncbi:MFS transporter [Rhodosalinus halophilus]|uniref:MFS transporter n=1 Tax=Rhodosalinus halophilus TaxID=2259333 RepID=A0A365U970_9RHOB|nr:MFS transporter [Rhodosalinus halophilus]RBI85509.1 MFS transporter [Rhodosalinus halophilus]